jgi:hypothetical protein
LHDFSVSLLNKEIEMTSSLSGVNNLSALAATQNQGGSSSSSSAASVEQTFLNYMKESPAQRMIDAWLKAHGLSEDALKKMPAAQREAIERQMADDIKKQVEQNSNALLG